MANRADQCFQLLHYTDRCTTESSRVDQEPPSTLIAGEAYCITATRGHLEPPGSGWMATLDLWGGAEPSQAKAGQTEPGYDKISYAEPGQTEPGYGKLR